MNADDQDDVVPTVEELRERERHSFILMIQEFQRRLHEQDAKNGITLQWLTNEEYGHQYVDFAQGQITLERVAWSASDRGDWIAKVFPVLGSELFVSLDQADGFPRYYFDETRAKLEMEAWAAKRKLL